MADQRIKALFYLTVVELARPLAIFLQPERLTHRFGKVGGFFAQAKKVTALPNPRAATC